MLFFSFGRVLSMRLRSVRSAFIKPALLSLGLMASISQASSAPEVVVSIHPVQLITAAITADVTKPQQLVPSGASPHNYSLKPSDMRRLTRSDLVIRIGSELEPFLDKPLKVTGAAHLDLLEIPGLKLEYFEEDEHDGHDHEAKGHEDHDDHKGHDDHEGHDDHKSHAGHEGHHHEDGANPHIWLSPENAIRMAEAISLKLQQIDAKNAELYKQNLQAFINEVSATDKQLKKLLAAQPQAGFFVFHDAWGYLVHHYGLQQLGVFTVSPEKQPGARHLAQLRDQLNNNPTACIFTEPQFRPVWISRLTSGLKNRVAELDPLATSQPATKTGYVDYLNNTVTTLQQCLSES
ncbi:zinc ABC transporter substrate-binding protein ZnuA [Spongorhabdus nitratireducens]